MGNNCDGVVDHVLEFSSDYDEMRRTWKYRVEQYDGGIEIEYWEY